MIRLAVRVAREQAELVLAELLELAPGGVEEVDRPGEGVVEYAVYGAPGELPSLPALRAAAGPALVEVACTEVGDDWSQRWREFHRPLVLGSELCVRPPWEPPVAQAAVDVVIDPGRAFGTGAHATTRLCLELMLDREPRGAFVDIGCGSGVLAIAAARLGWDPVLAVDSDPEALEVAAANAAANRVGIATQRLDIRTEQVPEGDLWVANVLAGPLRTWAGSQRRFAPAVILSGLLAGEAGEISGAFVARGLSERARRTAGEWAAVALDR